eukprot:RCo050261
MARTLPLWVCFVAAVLIFTGAFTASLWVTLDQAAVSSVDSIAAAFQANVMHDLEHRMESVLDGMLLLLNSWRALPGLVGCPPEEIMTYMYGVMSSTPAVEALAYVRPDGEFVGATLKPTGGVAVGHRGAAVTVAPVNMTLYSYNGSLGGAYRVVPFEGRQRPYYPASVAATGPVFTYTFTPTLNTADMISISTAVHHPNGTLALVLGVGYPFTTLTSELDTAFQELQSTGMLLLMEQLSGVTIASATASPATLPADAAEVYRVVLGSPDGYTARRTRLPTFGSAVVMQALLTSRHARGLQWRLVVVLPDSDYYSQIWHLSRVAGAEAGAILAVFVLTVGLMTHFLVTRPLRALALHVHQLQHTLSFGGGGSLEGISAGSGVPNVELVEVGRDSGRRSRFTEVRRLYE